MAAMLSATAATFYYFIREGKTLCSDRDSYIRLRKQRALMRHKIQQRNIILSCGVIIAAMIIGLAAPTGTPKQQPTVPVESTPQSIVQEEGREPYAATSTPTIESPSSTPSETLPPDIPTAEVFNVKLSESLQVVTFETCIDYAIEDYYTLVLALMWVESRYDVSAISRTNDYGLMQINKSNHGWLSEELGISDFLDAEQNIKAGVYMLSNYLLKYEDTHKALMAYNMGARRASKYWNKGVYTSAYSRKVVAAWDELKKTGTITE